MRLEFRDNKGAALSSLSQRLAHGPDGTIAAVEPLTITDLRVNSKLEVTDALKYDKMIMQRKSAETGNTGVDFVILGD